MNTFKELFIADLARYKGNPGRYLKIFLFFFRKVQTTRYSFYRKILNRIYCRISSYKNLKISTLNKITIGDDVMIAPNSFVNCDVPSHSIVYGNPCIIKQRDYATEDYVINLS